MNLASFIPVSVWFDRQKIVNPYILSKVDKKHLQFLVASGEFLPAKGRRSAQVGPHIDDVMMEVFIAESMGTEPQLDKVRPLESQS